MSKDLGASQANGLGAPEGAEPFGLRASPAIPSACAVCEGLGEYLIHDCHGGLWGAIRCPACRMGGLVRVVEKSRKPFAVGDEL